LTKVLQVGSTEFTILVVFLVGNLVQNCLHHTVIQDSVLS